MWSCLNGAASSLIIIDAQQATVDIVPNGLGDIDVSFPAGVVQDIAGNNSQSSGPFTTLFDPSSPMLTIVDVPVNGVATAPFRVTLNFSEPVLGLELADILVANGAATELQSLDADRYELVVTPDGTNNVTVTVPDNAAQSAANGTASSAASVTCHTE